MAGDGQVSLGQTILKQTARKIRRLHKDKVLAGFAGATSDAFALFSRFEDKLEEYRGNLGRAAIELAKDWRLDKALRQLEALLIVADKESSFLISGTGDVVEPDDGILAIGSGGPVRPGRGPGPRPPHRSVRQGHRPRGHAHRLGDLRLHQRPDHRRGAVNGHRAAASGPAGR